MDEAASVVLDPLPTGWVACRADLQRVAVHVLARRRHALVDRIGLRATPGGIGTPAAGPDHEVVRLAGTWLVREVSGASARTTALDLGAASLADAAALAQVDLSAPFDTGAGAPSVGDPHAPLEITPSGAAALATWFAFAWRCLDAQVTALGDAATPSVLQLWPEHFDAGCDVDPGDGERVNLGASPGDADHPEPYLYVGPWGAQRPGDARYWNAPFGARLSYADLLAAREPTVAAATFLRTGLDLLSSSAR